MQPLGAIGRLFHVFCRARRPHLKILGIQPAAGLLRYYFPLFSSRLRQQIWCFCTPREKIQTTRYRPENYFNIYMIILPFQAPALRPETRRFRAVCPRFSRRG